MTTTERLFTLAIVAFVLGFLALGAFYYEYRWIVFRFPLIVGLATVAFALGHLALGPRRSVEGPATEPETAEPAQPPSATPREAVIGFLWILGILPFIYGLGYLVGLPLYVLVYMRAHAQGWVLSLCVAAGTGLVTWVGFDLILGVLLPAFPDWLPD